MAHPDGSDAATIAPTFDTLCHRHGDLLNAQAEDRLEPAIAKGFIAEAAAAGIQIESVSDRDAIRSMINYWTGTLARLPATGEKSGSGAMEHGSEFERLNLARFDPSQSPDLDESRNPFVGLAAFDIGQSEVFFGRDQVVADLLKSVLAHNVVVVSGASGTGKSSLVRAGLVGALRSDPERADWIVAIASPGRDPIASLVAALAPEGQETAAWIEAGRATLDADPAQAGALVADRIGERSLLLVIDQLEEVFSLCPSEDRDRAAKAIGAIATLPRAHVVATIRDEYLEGERAQRVLLGLDLASAEEFRVPPLDTREIRAAIAEPAARAGLVFHDGLIDRIVAEVGTDPAALPLLQYALLQMWNERQGNRITLAVYEKVGGPATALSNAAQRIYDGFVPQTRQNTRIIFQQLIRPSLVYEFVRDRVSRGELERLLPPDSIRTVVKPFVEAGLMHVTPGTARAEDRIEISHEALIRNWDMLRRWASEVRDRERLFLEVDAQAKRWDDSGKSAGHLLFGKALKNAETAHTQYLSRARVDPIANARVQQYLSASRTQQRRLLSGVLTIALLGVVLLLGFFFLSGKYVAEAEKVRSATRIITNQDSELRAKEGQRATDDEAAVQFIQLLLTRGDISVDELPSQYTDMTPLATQLSVRGWEIPFDPRFLSPFDDILPTIAQRPTVLLRLPNLRIFYDPESGMPLLAISQNDRAAQAGVMESNALYSWLGLAGQIDQRLLAARGLVLNRLVDPREVAWGPQRERAAMAVNFLPLMFPTRQQGADPAQLGTWSTLSASLRARHNPNARQVVYVSGAVPGAKGEPPKMLWKVAVSINEAEQLVADAFTLPARRAPETSVIVTLNHISANAGVDFSRLKDALAASGQATSVTRQVPVDASISPNVYIQAQGVTEDQATAIRLSIAGMNFRTPPVQQVGACVRPAQVRYYYPQDAEAAAIVAKLAGSAILDAKLGDGQVRVVKMSLKSFPKARPDNLELWLCGSEGSKQ